MSDRNDSIGTPQQRDHYDVISVCPAPLQECYLVFFNADADEIYYETADVLAVFEHRLTTYSDSSGVVVSTEVPSIRRTTTYLTFLDYEENGAVADLDTYSEYVGVLKPGEKAEVRFERELQRLRIARHNRDFGSLR